MVQTNFWQPIGTLRFGNGQIFHGLGQISNEANDSEIEMLKGFYLDLIGRRENESLNRRSKKGWNRPISSRQLRDTTHLHNFNKMESC